MCFVVNSNFRGVSLVTLLVYVLVCNNQLLRDVYLITKNLKKLRIYNKQITLNSHSAKDSYKHIIKLSFEHTIK